MGFAEKYAWETTLTRFPQRTTQSETRWLTEKLSYVYLTYVTAIKMTPSTTPTERTTSILTQPVLQTRTVDMDGKEIRVLEQNMDVHVIEDPVLQILKIMKQFKWRR